MTAAKNARIYTTVEVARFAGVHVNTVRFYESIGFLTKPERLENGYRAYTRLQLLQCALSRRAMRAEVLLGGLRKKAAEIVLLCAGLEFDVSLDAAEEYRAMIEGEISAARAAVRSVEGALRKSPLTTSGPELRRREAAQALQVTPETLRTWERNGLLSVPRSKNGYRVYSSEDLERLNIIRTLRRAGYSLSAILRLLSGLDENASRSVADALDTPNREDDVVSACDRLISALQSTAEDALELIRMVGEIRDLTIQ